MGSMAPGFYCRLNGARVHEQEGRGRRPLLFSFTFLPSLHLCDSPIIQLPRCHLRGSRAGFHLPPVLLLHWVFSFNFLPYGKER